MARIVECKEVDASGKESIVIYHVCDAPDDILFGVKDGVLRANWWDRSKPAKCVAVPVDSIVSIT